MKNDSMIRILPTCVPQNADDVRENINKIKAFSNGMHLDIDDGKFTPEASWPFKEISKKGSGKWQGKGIEEALDTPVDNFVIQIHLMASDGREAGEGFIQAGARSIIIHVESSITPFSAFTDTLGAWSMLGVEEIGIAILLDTPLEKLDPLLPFCDFLHVMSVATIGAQGAPFDPRAIDRVGMLHQSHPDFPIQVDGAVSRENIRELVRAGATRFAIGSSIAAAASPAEEYATLLQLAHSAT